MAFSYAIYIANLLYTGNCHTQRSSGLKADTAKNDYADRSILAKGDNDHHSLYGEN